MGIPFRSMESGTYSPTVWAGSPTPNLETSRPLNDAKFLLGFRVYGSGF